MNEWNGDPEVADGFRSGHVARRTDGRWSSRVLNWVPITGERRRGRPAKRWEDDLNEFAASKMSRWEVRAKNRAMWDSLEDEYVAWASENIGEKLD